MMGVQAGDGGIIQMTARSGEGATHHMPVMLMVGNPAPVVDSSPVFACQCTQYPSHFLPPYGVSNLEHGCSQTSGWLSLDRPPQTATPDFLVSLLHAITHPGPCSI